MKDVKQAVIDAIETVIGIDISDSGLNDDLYETHPFDGYDMMDVAMYLEDELDISIDEDELSPITTAAQLIALVENKLS